MSDSILIKIPQQYKERFSVLGDKGMLWYGRVLQFICNAQDYISQTPFFFPEYTKHTIEHINNVLDISEKLISAKTMQSLGADSFAILIMSIISHDIGMFVKPDGLAYLLEQNEERDDGELSWRIEWEKYQVQLNHYSGKEIKRCFGDPANFAVNEAALTQLPDRIDASRLSPWEIRLCGEFLRKMHPRLAQEIIESGFPGYKQCDLFAAIDMDHEYRKLIGIAARSHGMDLNRTDSMLKIFDEEAPSQPCGIPIYYVMGILRMADYLDAGKDRAPHAITAMQHFESELSYDEFAWNRRICLGDDWGEKNYERLYIRVDTSSIDSRIFLKVEEWLKSLQRELDICWRQISLYYKDSYRFTVRRIDSNIFQQSTRKQLERNIVIEKAHLQAAPEILELLIAPLYGSDAKYGVRELLQNAIDACRERTEMECKRGNTSYQGNVCVELNAECEQSYFSIKDNGCGMDQEVILKYFLVAGSSYRNSPQWKEQFGSQDINRSGKFGIGVLAAFLLGNRIEVETRPLGKNESFFFEINNENYEQINIFRKGAKKHLLRKKEFGTCIRIDMERELAKKMVAEFNNGKASSFIEPYWTQWFWLPVPVVQYLINGQEWKNPYGCVDWKEAYGLQENGRWFELKERGAFDQVWWTPEESNCIWCNGIFITNDPDDGIGQYRKPLSFSQGGTHDFCLKVPALSVMDSKCTLDLNLSRNKVQNFPKEIRKALYIENCKLALSLLMLLDFSEQKELLPEFPFGIKRIPEKIENLLFCKEGYNVPICRVLRQISGERIWLLYRDRKWDEFDFDKLEDIVSLMHYGDHIDREEDIRDGLFNAFWVGYEKSIVFDSIYIKKNYINNFLDEKPSAKINRKRAFSKKIEETANDCYDFKITDDIRPEYFEDLDSYVAYLNSGKVFPHISEVTVEKQDYLVAAKKKSAISGSRIKDLLRYCDVACGYQVLSADRNMIKEVEELLDEYIGDKIWIPYNIDDRKKFFPRFFDPKDDIYKYVMLASKQSGFYSVGDVTEKS